MPAKTDRPQDVGRSRRRRGIPSADTLAILARYRAALRDELGATLDRLAGEGVRDTDERAKLWRHARQTAHELAEGDDPPALGMLAPAAAGGASGVRPPRLTARDRAALDR